MQDPGPSPDFPTMHQLAGAAVNWGHLSVRIDLIPEEQGFDPEIELECELLTVALHLNGQWAQDRRYGIDPVESGRQPGGYYLVIEVAPELVVKGVKHVKSELTDFLTELEEMLTWSNQEDWCRKKRHYADLQKAIEHTRKKRRLV